MAKIDKQILVNSLKHYHDCLFTPGIYEHSIIGQAALLLEKSEEVVRCKNCTSYSGTGWCCEHDTSMEADDFCSYGERREGE